jgi:hypothetical protein
MNKKGILAQYDDLRIHGEYPGTRTEITLPVVRLVDVSNGWEGMVIYSNLDESNAETVIQEQVDYFQKLHQNFEWKVFDYDRPADLKARLKQHGFKIEGKDALLILDLQKASGSLWEPIQHDVRRILDPADLPKVREVEEKVWHEDCTWVVTYLGNALREDPPHMSIYLATVNGEPACTAWIHFPQNSPFASLFGGSTVAAYRRQGVYAAVLAARAQEARQRGVRYLTVDASRMSRPILEKYGFELIGWSNPCKWKSKKEE